MKKLFKVLLASSMVLSLAACSSEESSSWVDELEGDTKKYTINYNNQERDIVVQVPDETNLNFYFDGDEEDQYSSFTLPFGKFYSDPLNDVSFEDYNDDGYDDIEFEFYSNLNLEDDVGITVQCLYVPENGQFEIDNFYIIVGDPDEEYVDTWYFDANTNEKSFVIDEKGNWATYDNNGEFVQKGFSYQFEDIYILLYNYSGEWVGSIQMDDDGSLMVLFDDNVENYYRASQSTAQ